MLFVFPQTQLPVVFCFMVLLTIPNKMDCAYKFRQAIRQADRQANRQVAQQTER